VIQETEPNEDNIDRELTADEEEEIALESVSEKEVARLILLRLLKASAPEYTHMSLYAEMGNIHPEAFYAALWTLNEKGVVSINAQQVTLAHAVRYLTSIGMAGL
jgi:predicted component of type VI protein secretion system